MSGECPWGAACECRAGEAASVVQEFGRGSAPWFACCWEIGVSRSLWGMRLTGPGRSRSLDGGRAVRQGKWCVFVVSLKLKSFAQRKHSLSE